MSESWIDDDWYEDIDYSEPEPDPYQYIMGMDPGGTTGVAMLRISLEDEKAKPELIYLHQIADGRYGFKEFFGGSAIGSNLTVVSEKWRERNVKGANREPQYIEGGIHMLWGEENVEWQYPDVKDVITDEYLKSQNLWTEGMPHQMDALRHALAYLRNSGHDGTLDTMNPDGDGETIAQPGEADEAQLGQGEGESGGDEGEPQPNFAEIVEAFTQAAKEMGEATQEAAEAAQAAGEAMQEATSGGFAEVKDDGRERSKRERNGAFAGFNPADYEDGGTTLLDD